MSSLQAKIKRVYEEPDAGDGFRILVDRLWPRGLTKARAKVDLWLRDIAPSTELRKWFSHDPVKWEEFQRRYLAELHQNGDQVEMLLLEAKKRSSDFALWRERRTSKRSSRSSATVETTALGNGSSLAMRQRIGTPLLAAGVGGLDCENHRFDLRLQRLLMSNR